MFKERQAVAIPVQEHSQVVIDICLGKFVGKLSQIQYRLRNLQTIGVDSTVSVLSQTEFLCKQRTDAKPSAIPKYVLGWCIVVQGKTPSSARLSTPEYGK